MDLYAFVPHLRGKRTETNWKTITFNAFDTCAVYVTFMCALKGYNLLKNKYVSMKHCHLCEVCLFEILFYNATAAAICKQY